MRHERRGACERSRQAARGGDVPYPRLGFPGGFGKHRHDCLLLAAAMSDRDGTGGPALGDALEVIGTLTNERLGTHVDPSRRRYFSRSMHVAPSGEFVDTILATIAEKRPDVILLDLLMPRMDGFGVIDQLQQDPQSGQIPIIVLTAKALTATERVTLDQTVRTVIQKRGLDRDTLLRELRGLLRAYRDPTPKGLNP